MKLCRKCGVLNKDENNFCNSCGSSDFSGSSAQPAMPDYVAGPEKDDFTWYEVFTIFSFVASLIGCLVIPLILDPLALAAGIAGFAGGKRYKGLAVAAIVIAAINLLIRLFLALHDNGVIPGWFITGTLN